MSTTQDLISSLERLLKLHKSLFDIAVRKTEYIKVGDMNALDKVINEEQSHIIAIQQLEQNRQNAVIQVIPDKDNPSVRDCIDVSNDQEKEKLSVLAIELHDVMLEIKERNYLNQQLIHQSLQFVNVSLSLLRPQSELMNYVPPKDKQRTNIKETLFNSRA